MRFDIHLRADVTEKIGALARQMHDWEEVPRIGDDEAERVRETIQPFSHTTSVKGLSVGGADGTGVYPAVTYADSFIYITLAQATVYRAEPRVGLREVTTDPPSLLEFTWLPEDEARRRSEFDRTFAALAGADVQEVIRSSDYSRLKQRHAHGAVTVAGLFDGLVRPHAADAGNIAIQLRSCGEMGAALKILRESTGIDLFLMDGTLSLPFVSRQDTSLFHEHLKRLCCVEARSRGIAFAAVSKSHGLPSSELIENLAREKLGLTGRTTAEHWYLRLPRRGIDSWEFTAAAGRNMPPPGAVTYLLRFHRNIPIMRLDIDEEYWKQQIRGASESETLDNERRLFENLDYTCHDQRSYGYPYPIKAAHDRASLTKPERVALRKQIVDAAVAQGMKRSLFRDVSIATGHE